MKISKTHAASAQLRTAIQLWFSEKDLISAHTLAVAAYEIFHMVSLHRDKYRRDLLFDSDLIKDEYRKDWRARLKKEANFFKHADRDPDAEIDFNPDVTRGFILFAILGRSICNEPRSHEELAFLLWLQIQHPNMLTESGRKFTSDHIPSDKLEDIKSLPKQIFFKALIEELATRVIDQSGLMRF